MKNLTEQSAETALQPNTRRKAKSTRVFFALWPNLEIQQQLHTLAKQLQPQCQGRVMRAETLHMTLQFIGNIPRSLLPKIIAALSKFLRSLLPCNWQKPLTGNITALPMPL